MKFENTTGIWSVKDPACIIGLSRLFSGGNKETIVLETIRQIESRECTTTIRFIVGDSKAIYTDFCQRFKDIYLNLITYHEENDKIS